MPFDIPKIAELVDEVSKISIVRPTGVTNVIGMSGFVFDITDTEEISLTSDITDHFVEDNTSIADHISLKPEKVTVRGFIGELKQLFNNEILEIVTAVQRLFVLGAYLPTFSPQAKDNNDTIINTAINALSAVDLATSIYDVFSDKNTSANKQQTAFNFFYSMYLSRQLFTVETPYNIFSNMVMESCRVIQDGKTAIITDILITFKKIRTVETEFSSSLVSSGRKNDMSSEFVEKGLSKGQEVESSTIEKFF